jgi:hypothetical protein
MHGVHGKMTMEKETEDFVVVEMDDAARDASVVRDHLDSLISDYIDQNADTLWPINKKIHDNPELGYKEKIAHAALTGFLKTREGWKVTPSAYGLETAFVAVYDSGKKGPVISYNAEMGKNLYYLDESLFTYV